MSFGRSESTFRREMAERTMESLANRLLDLDSRIEVRNNEAIHAQTVTAGSETPGTDLNPIPNTGNSASGSLVDDNRQHQNQFEVPATDMTDDMDTVKFVESMKNKNTLRKTKGELKKFEEYLCSVNEMRPVSEIDARGLDTYLARFFLSAKKNNGEEYEPDSLKSFQLSVNRHLNEKGIKMNLVEDVEFKHSRDVLMSKRKLLKQQGKGNRENKAEILSKDEINILYEKNLLGTANAKALINLMYVNNTMHLGLRSHEVHTHLRWGDIQLLTTATGEEYLEYNERATKTRTGATSDCRPFKPKMFAQPNNPRCPVKAYKLFKDKRPDEMRNADTPFYIGIGKNDKWFINQAMGKNTIAKLVKTMCDAAELPGKKSNHSLRRTAITTLVHAGVEPTVVQQLSGHKSIQSINNYSTASVNQQKNMSGIITEYTTGNDMNQMKEEVNETTSMNRSSQEEVENIIKEITSYENLQLEDLQTTNTPLSEQIQPVHSEYIPNSAYLSPNLNQNTFNKNSVTVFNRQSAPIRNKFPYPEYPGNILAGASISGNVTINMNIGKGRKRKVDEGPEYDSESE